MTGFIKQATIYAATTLFMVSGAAAAQARVVGGGELPHRAVSYADLDLTSPAGKATLNMRVRGAAKRLCSAPGTQPVSEQSRRRQCFKAAVASAEPQIAKAVADSGSRFARRSGIELALTK